MSRTLNISLTDAQAAFATATDTYPAVVAGYGSGKTQSLAARLLMKKLEYPKGWVGYYAPNYDLISKIAVPRLSELLDQHGLPYKYNKTDKMIHVAGYGAFILRTMDNPSMLVGYEHADAGVDELDTMREVQADAAWKKIVARNRQKKPFGQKNSVAVATTPEGFRFTYKQWVLGNTDPKSGPLGPRKGYKLYRATTYSNAHNLSDDYISNLEGDYPPNLLQAYLNGEFVNLTSGAVYPDFDRDLNRTVASIGEHEEIHIGMDFNIYHMAAVVFVIRDGQPLALEEITDKRDTPQMIEEIRTRYGHTRNITIYPDAAGGQGTTKGATLSDINLLRVAKFNLLYPTKNPLVKDRVAAMNAQILNAKGARNMRVNIDNCPKFAQALEQQVYDVSGRPDKGSGLDHVVDAAGYFIHQRFPILFAMQRTKFNGV